MQGYSLSFNNVIMDAVLRIMHVQSKRSKKLTPWIILL
jgi:hypothetical protein